MPAEPFKHDGQLNDGKKQHILSLSGRSVLDVGCNTGELVGWLNSAGIHAEGIDINEEYILAARKKFPDLKFHVGSDLSIFSDGQFDTVVAWDVLEHISDDVAAMQAFVRIAKSNVVLSVPKEDGISLPHSRVTYRPYVDPTHVRYYTRQSINQLVSRCGDHRIHIEDDYRIRPLLAYKKIGIPLKICDLLDRLMWSCARHKEPFFANLTAVITKLPLNSRSLTTF